LYIITITLLKFSFTHGYRFFLQHSAVCKLCNFSFSDPDAAEDVPWIRIILQQMRLLDCIVDGNILNERLFAVLDAAPLAVSSSLKHIF
jgi:hypothetical protein